MKSDIFQRVGRIPLQIRRSEGFRKNKNTRMKKI